MSYLDLRSAMLENEEKQRLLQRMVDQQAQLQSLQERQKALLDAQQHASKLDYLATHDLQAKLERLQAVKGRITALQSLLDNAEMSSSHSQFAAAPVMLNGSGDDVGLGESHKSDTSKHDASTLVNEQLENLYDTVSKLLTDIDNMNVANSLIGQQEQVIVNEAKWAKSSLENKTDQRSPKSTNISSSPLPYVNLVENDQRSCKKVQSYRLQLDDGKDSSFVERHFHSPIDSTNRSKSNSESSFNETTAAGKSASELWEEMRRYQTQLAELQEKRKQLSTYIRLNQEIKDAASCSEHSDAAGKIKQSRPNEAEAQQARSFNDSKTEPMKYYLGQSKSNNVDCQTEQTNATWGGSTSTSGDESGFASKFAYAAGHQPVKISGDEEGLVRLSISVEESVYDLWDALDYHNNFLHVLLDDQKALSVLLQNTLSMQKENHISSALYGISPDFLIYQLDNCSSQILAFQKHIVTLHKELANIQRQYPEIDVSYSHTKPTHRYYYTHSDEVSFLDNSRVYTPQRSFLKSKSSTPLNYNRSRNINKASPSKNIPSTESSPYQNPFSLPSHYLTELNLLANKPDSDISDYKKKILQETASPTSSPMGYVNRIQATNALKTKVAKSQSPAVKTELERNFPGSRHKTVAKHSKPDISDIDSNASGHPLFEALRDSIYSEAATLISQNEARPHFLIELFHELQQLNSDYLRQHCLFMIRDIVSGYIVETPKQGKEHKANISSSQSTQPKAVPVFSSVYTDLISDMKTLYSENTPSESDAESETMDLRRSNGEALQYDFALEVSSASNMTTPYSSQEYAIGESNVPIPFEDDYLGSTVIHLDEALQRVREIERMKQDNSDFKKRDKIECQPSQTVPEDKPENLAQRESQRLDEKIRNIISKIIPQIKSLDEVCSEEKIEEICELVLSLIMTERNSSTDQEIVWSKKTNEQLQSLISQCLSKFIGYHMSECGEEMIVDISELLFNELAYIYMIEDYEEADEDDNRVDAEIIDTVVEEGQSSQKQEDLSESSENNEESESSSSMSPTKEVDDEKTEFRSSNLQASANETANDSVVVDLSVSETKPLTSYGSGEDEEAGSGDEYVQYNETDDVPTSMQHDQSCPEKLKE